MCVRRRFIFGSGYRLSVTTHQQESSSQAGIAKSKGEKKRELIIVGWVEAVQIVNTWTDKVLLLLQNTIYMYQHYSTGSSATCRSREISSVLFLPPVKTKTGPVNPKKMHTTSIHLPPATLAPVPPPPELPALLSTLRSEKNGCSRAPCADIL